MNPVKCQSIEENNSHRKKTPRSLLIALFMSVFIYFCIMTVGAIGLYSTIKTYGFSFEGKALYIELLLIILPYLSAVGLLRRSKLALYATVVFLGMSQQLLNLPTISAS